MTMYFPCLIGIILFIAPTKTSATLNCWEAQTWVDKDEHFTSNQDGPQYSGGRKSFKAIACPPETKLCYRVAMAIKCPWSEFIQRKNGCYSKDYLKREQAEVEKYMCENPEYEITEVLCHTRLCNRIFTVTTTTIEPPTTPWNGTLWNGTHWITVTTTAKPGEYWNGTHWIEIPTKPTDGGEYIWNGTHWVSPTTANPYTTPIAGGFTTSGDDYWYDFYFDEGNYYVESSFKKWRRISIFLGIAFASVSTFFCFCCFWSFWFSRNRKNYANRNANQNAQPGDVKVWKRGWQQSQIDVAMPQEEPLLGLEKDSSSQDDDDSGLEP